MRALLMFLTSLVLGLSPAVHAAGERPLTLGVVPYLSARAIVQLYRPLEDQLERNLQRPVRLVTAPDYFTFLDKTAKREYDLIATSPAFGRLAQLDTGYVPLLRPVNSLEVLLVTLSDSRIQELPQLRGQTVATTDALATLTLAGQRGLKDKGLVPGRDVTVRPTNSHANSLAAMQRGDAVAAITSATALKQLGQAAGAPVRVLAQLGVTTPLLYLVSPALSNGEVETLRRTMMEFANGTDAGRKFVNELGHGGLAPVSPKDMASLDPLVSDLRAQLESTR
ncbi:phosphate/phosphite/phosphonate ABC transporter substrate-binding protein [Azohydromonas caseinilytica]|uniref:Phosphate/phosphite/phosphonate ABC transporter substrate-binding protein n=1 Tax=Azohydromonas caseinilytica TaxID=2728836 RepID=A0A848FFE5_9BURK|nr:phosphate/phosphite/phosphonate ABC transporter substrate-binding protein [Azohydromonas caseinilytica]NML18002.1 phosphate/phosphite/phosphonate ABC transporter substrate-binding protein [Azohydromonas caseinilytica]